MADTADLRRTAATAIASFRLGYGILMLLAPRWMIRLQTGETPTGTFVWLAKAFGIRDAVLGAGALLAPDDTARRAWVAAGAVSDGTDAVTAVLGSRWLGRRNAVLGGLAAAGATVAAGWSLSRQA